MKSAVILISIFIAATGLCLGGEPNPQAQLDSIKAVLEQKRSEYSQIGQKERNELTRLRTLEEEIALSGKLMLKYKRQIENLTGEISQQNIDLENALLVREYKKELLYNRLNHIYKISSSQRQLNILLRDSPSALVSAAKNMSLLVQYDRQLANKYGELTKSIEGEIGKLETNLASLSKLKSDSEFETESRKKTAVNRKNLVDKLRRDKEYVAASIQRLEQDAIEVASIIEDLENQQIKKPLQSESNEFQALKGQLLWPYKGEIIRTFGAIKDKRGIVISNPGIDIKTPYGADIAAAAEGSVIYVSWLRGYGQFVIMEHTGGYYTLYANLSDIFVEVGDNVYIGEVIGQAGDSGSLEGPKLHFEVRHRKTQLDPLEWLIK